VVIIDRSANADGPGIVGLALGCFGMLCTVLGCFCSPIWALAVLAGGIGFAFALGARPGLRLAGVVLNVLVLFPTIVMAALVFTGFGLWAAQKISTKSEPAVAAQPDTAFKVLGKDWQARAAANGEWVDAVDEKLMQGIAVVGIATVRIGRVEGEKLGEWMESDKECLQITVAIMNGGQSGSLSYTSWGPLGDIALGNPVKASLIDDFGFPTSGRSLERFSKQGAS
jgi:hypothetical protein